MFGVWGLWAGSRGSGIGVRGSESRDRDLGFGVWGLRLGVGGSTLGLGFVVWGAGFGLWN